MKAWYCFQPFVALLVFSLGLAQPAAAQEGDPAQGGRTYHRQCGHCHSITPDRHMTGPSLAGVIGRKAGSVASFDRYSKASRDSAVVWNAEALASWLTNPQALMGGTSMPAVALDAKARADIVAYLSATQTPGVAPLPGIAKPPEKNLDLKSASAATLIAKIGLCKDTYTVTLQNGVSLTYWEPNLRFKTDGSLLGPNAAKPVLVPTGMHGDRSYAIFASPQEIGSFVQTKCGG